MVPVAWAKMLPALDESARSAAAKSFVFRFMTARSPYVGHYIKGFRSESGAVLAILGKQ
jgi:hypothetical protein